MGHFARQCAQLNHNTVANKQHVGVPSCLRPNRWPHRPCRHRRPRADGPSHTHDEWPSRTPHSNLFAQRPSSCDRTRWTSRRSKNQRIDELSTGVPCTWSHEVPACKGTSPASDQPWCNPRRPPSNRVSHRFPLRSSRLTCRDSCHQSPWLQFSPTPPISAAVTHIHAKTPFTHVQHIHIHTYTLSQASVQQRVCKVQTHCEPHRQQLPRYK
jgi:hypothetical protein